MHVILEGNEFKIEPNKLVIEKFHGLDISDFKVKEIVNLSGASFLEIILSLPNMRGLGFSVKGVRIVRTIKGMGMKTKGSIQSASEDTIEHHETNTNSRHIDFLLGTTLFEISELKREMENLDQTCSIGVTYNRPPNKEFSE